MVKEKSNDSTNVRIVLTGPDGHVKVDETVENLRTDVGDQFWSNRAFDDTYDIATGMKLGNGSTAVAKNGAGSGMTTYITTSQQAFNTAVVAASKGAGAGWRVTFVSEWAPGVATDSNINEVCITNQTALADNTSLEADTLARVLTTTTIDKQAGDTLTVTWQFDTLGQ